MLTTKPLPIPTNATKSGPVIQHDGSTLGVRYDYEQDNGEIDWANVIFTDVLAYVFHQSSCSEFGSNLKNSQISKYDTSIWAESLLDKWDKCVGWQDYQKSLGGRARFSHYVLYFDDVGVLEVLASEVSSAAVSGI